MFSFSMKKKVLINSYFFPKFTSKSVVKEFEYSGCLVHFLIIHVIIHLGKL